MCQEKDMRAQYDVDTQRLVYQLSMERLIESDAKLWQVPALSLTAQAFLLTIALGSRAYEPGERVIAACLGLLVALASIQLMERHRYHAECDVNYLKSLEIQGVMPPLVNREDLTNALPATGIRKYRSAKIWKITLFLFVLANSIAAVSAIIALL